MPGLLLMLRTLCNKSGPAHQPSDSQGSISVVEAGKGGIPRNIYKSPGICKAVCAVFGPPQETAAQNLSVRETSTDKSEMFLCRHPPIEMPFPEGSSAHDIPP